MCRSANLIRFPLFQLFTLKTRRGKNAENKEAASPFEPFEKRPGAAAAAAAQRRRLQTGAKLEAEINHSNAGDRRLVSSCSSMRDNTVTLSFPRRGSQSAPEDALATAVSLDARRNQLEAAQDCCWKFLFSCSQQPNANNMGTRERLQRPGRETQTRTRRLLGCDLAATLSVWRQQLRSWCEGGRRGSGSCHALTQPQNNRGQTGKSWKQQKKKNLA